MKKIMKKHRNKDVSIRMTETQFNEFMRLLEDCDNIDIELQILADQIIDEERES